MQQRRRLCLGLAAAWPMAAWSSVGNGSRPLHLVVPFAAGGPADTLARVLAPPLGEQLGQPVLVENRPGAGGSVGAEMVARAAPDGHTLLMATTSTHGIAPLLNPRLPYDPVADFTPVVAVATAPGVVLVPPGSPARTLEEFIALARRQPGRLSYGSSGVGTIVHLATELLKVETGIYVVHIPYRGTALALADLMAGTIDLLLDSVLTGMPPARAGRVRALAATSVRRSPLAPDLPAVAEVVPGYDAATLFSLVAPRGLPAERTLRINQAVDRVLADAEVEARLARSGAEPAGGSPEELQRRLRADSARWARVVAARGLKLD